MFAHLAVICKAPLPNNKLHNYLQGYDNLCMFCGRVLQRYFPPEPEGMVFCLNIYTLFFNKKHFSKNVEGGGGGVHTKNITQAESQSR